MRVDLQRARAVASAIIGGRENALPLAILAVLCIVPKFVGLTAQSLNLDELNVLRLVSFPHLDEALFHASRQEPPLWIALMWTYTKLFGTTPLALRLSSAVIASLAVVVCYRTAQQAFGTRVAMITAALLGLSSVGLYEAQDVHPSSLVFLLAAISAAWFVDVARAPEANWQRIWRLAAVNALLCLTHYSGIFLSLGEVLTLGVLEMWHGSRPRPLTLRLAALTAAAVPSLIWMWWTHAASTPVTFMPWGLTDLVSPVSAFFGQIPILVLAVLPLLIGRRVLVMDAKIAALTCVVMIVVVGITAAALIHPSWMQNKNFYVAFPAGYLLFALLLSKTRLLRTQTGIWLTILVCTAGLGTYLATGYPLQKSNYYSPYREQVREASDLISKLAGPRDTVLAGMIGLDGSALVPTRDYAEQITHAKWRAHSVENFVISPVGETRLETIVAAIARLQPQGVLFIDLPQAAKLSPAEDSFIDGAAACITEHKLVMHTVLEIRFQENQCPKRIVLDAK